MTRYVETFKIGRWTFGIEDHEDGAPPEDHFFPHEYKEGRCKRFRLWRSGGGFGQADTLEEARQMVVDRALAECNLVYEEAKAQVAAMEFVFARLSEPAHLFRFEETEQ